MSGVHLAHKIHWNLMAVYVTPGPPGRISLPTGKCGRIHLTKKKHQIQVDHRNYITDADICTADDCETTGTKLWYKKNKRGIPFGVGVRCEEKAVMFSKNLFNVIHEFALTELKSPVKTVEYTIERTSDNDDTWCRQCDDFITYMEFGDKKKLFEYSESDLREIFSCQHGGQAVGNNLRFLMWRILRFYVFSNVIVYLDLKEDQWPEIMKPKSYFRRSLHEACDGQTFLPHSRKYLDCAMIDLDQTRKLSKNLFRFLYFVEMMHMRLDSSYRLQDEYGDIPFRTWW